MSPKKTEQTDCEQSITGLVDMRILQPGGDTLGHVDELLIDLRDGRVAYLVALCLDGRRRTIPWRLVHCTGSDFRLNTELEAPTSVAALPRICPGDG